MPNDSPSLPILILFGPTASGKTSILEKLFAGQGALYGDVLRAEVISADSMQVYRGMDIGTAKPSLALRESLPHHLIDILDPSQQFNVGRFVRLADEAARGIQARGALPVVSGGTGFYLRSFILGLPEAPPSDQAIRQALREELAVQGAPALHAELALCDPLSAQRIHPQDVYRLLRALEVYRLTGKPLSSFHRPDYPPRDGASKEGPPVEDLPGDSESVERSPQGRPYRFLIIGLSLPREVLYQRINQRCSEMFRNGLPEEVQRLREAGYGPEDPGMKGIGYREFFDLQPGADPKEAEPLVAQNSRRYAKRQITYFSALRDVYWVSALDDPVEEMRGLISQFLAQGP